MGKITVITGGTSGIGRGIAEKILAESAKADRIFVTYGHDEKKALSFQESLPEEKRSQVTLIKADMSSYEEMMVFVEELKKQTDHIDWLVSNAGISTYAKYEDYSFEEWTRIVNTNLIYGQRAEIHDGRGRQCALYRFLCRTAGVFFLPCIWSHQGSHPFPDKIPGKGI